MRRPAGSSHPLPAKTPHATAPTPCDRNPRSDGNRDQLVAILTYHVVPGKVEAADVVNLDEATTVNGQDVQITVADSGVQINDANVIKTDIEASNGVIHVIDTVILPAS